MNPRLRYNTALLLIFLYSAVSMTTACRSDKSTAANQTASQNANQPPISLDDLVAPIALYPDQLLGQVLTAAMNPQEVLDGGNWLLQNQNLKGDALINAAKQADFGASMQYLMAFPQVVDTMCQEMNWTTQLGEAFKNDQKGVMDAVQRKRTQAQHMGNLASSPQMTVETKKAEDSSKEYVEIKPADPKVVYVPQYNPVTIYNTQAPAVQTTAPAAAPAATTSTSSSEKESDGVSTGTAVAIGLLSFGVGMAVGSTFNNNYYPYPAWGYGGMYYGGRPYYPPPYRPAYPAYRPANGYNNRNTNININNDYYGRFNHQNRPSQLPGNSQVGRGGGNVGRGSTNVGRGGAGVSTLPSNNRVGQGGQSNWKGQNTYQGARASTREGQKPGASMANAVPRDRSAANRGSVNQAANRESFRSNSPSGGGYNRPATSDARAGGGAPRASTQPSASRPGGASPSAGNMAARPSAQPNPNRGGDRGFGDSPSASARPSASPSASTQDRGDRGGAFGGGGSSGGSERAASSRGRSSMGGGGGGRSGGRSGGGGRRR
jgi:hypothetical protein